MRSACQPMRCRRPHFTRSPRFSLEMELVDRIRDAEADFLGRAVVDLLVSMHHGGSGAKTGQVMGCGGEQPQIEVR